MNTVVHSREGVSVAEVQADDVIIRDVGDALDVFASAQYAAQAPRVIVHATNIDQSFFDLSSGLAGEVLQKISNYGLRLAIVGEFEEVSSRALRDFIRESNEYGQVVFVADVESAVDRLAASGHGRA